MATDTELAATKADAKRRLRELRAVAARLWPDREDGLVMSELVSVVGQIRQCEQAINEQ